MRPSPSSPGAPMIDVEMRDEDVIRKVAALFGVKYRLRDRHRVNMNVTYHVRMSGKRAASLMWQLKPYMSERRQAQIDRAVQCYVDRGEAFHPANLPKFEFLPTCVETLCPFPPAAGHTTCEVHSLKKAA